MYITVFFDFEVVDDNNKDDSTKRFSHKNDNKMKINLISIPIIEGIKMRIHSDFIQFIDALKSTPSVSKYRPPFLIRTLQSRACRSAIMFGDELTNAEGKALISRLSNCSMPFICAHGRPTLAPM